MNDQFEPKITNLCVSKLRNSPAITFVSCLDLESQLNLPSFNQRLPRVLAIFIKSMRYVSEMTMTSIWHISPQALLANPLKLLTLSI
jgi:hypothetical protein